MLKKFKLWNSQLQGWSAGSWASLDEALAEAKLYRMTVSVQEYDENIKRYVHRFTVLPNGDIQE